ncbi:MAG: phosphatidylserine decarboxylase family protein [Verrucomicrobia bacterium]|nr:phosphatidylserine decarboxylase family protein [Verrucomicrobiota bacterium]MCG2680146.1 phosphatidylserine decarboxylase [Kiritimatiellia bacterium]MBU4247055.1 phosphatidylserine decarboxylase family protein [Verrucomicrobiota bacterium]MBU4291129.1 phosphatidylserine decarboxylase family protein [Verrucomicrobiota bacterium]MBU4429295.1 phosphatidylserine decarboxylase family protein [Verrucomicrobiota bacterium]
MPIPIVKEVLPFLIGCLVIFGALGIVCRLVKWRRTAILCFILAIVSACYMLYFFRDPERTPSTDTTVVVAGADGVVMSIKEMPENAFLKTETVRISIFLSLFDVHVNRAPVAGTITFLQYYPGARYFTFQEKSSDYNQHNSILIEGPQTRCLVNQIVGPVARRVVYWLTLNQDVALGERIGMMKFGSRLDMYLPKSDVNVVIRKGDRVKAGLTVVATIKPKGPKS